MPFKKSAERSDQEWRAFAHWWAHPVDAVKDWFKVTPDDWQGDLLTELFTKTDRVAAKAAHGPGKGLCVDELVLAPDGWRKIGDLKEGDQVATQDGTFTKVLGIYPRGVLPMWRVTLSDGSFVDVDGDHLWWTDTRTQRCGKTRDDNHVRTVIEIRDTLTFANGKTRGFNHRIPTAKPIAHPERSLPVDPYILGFFLGDGCASGRMDYAALPQEKRILINGKKHLALDIRKKLGLDGLRSYEKFIPREYLYASIGQRTALLQGLLDTDGECSKGNNVTFSTTSPRLRDGAAELCRSLGGVARVSAGRFTRYTHKGKKRTGRESWRVSMSLSPDIVPFRHEKKAALYQPSLHANRTRVLSRFIVSVEPAPSADVVCIKVAHPSELFITKDHIVTHNTAVDAWATWIFLNCRPDCRVVATAPTYAQLHDVLFPEIARWHNKFNSRMAEEWAISAGHVRSKAKDKHNVWFAVARTSNRPENLQGFHGNDILLIADEASAVPANVFEVMEGALSEAGEEGKLAKLLMAGNPNFNAGELYNAFSKNKDLYRRYTITGDTKLIPALGLTANGQYHRDHGLVYYSKRVKPKYVQTIERKYGKDSAIFDVRVRGIFPRVSDDAIIPLEWAERAALLPLPSFDPRADQVTVVIDPSRGGAAETAIGCFRKGVCYKIDGHKTTSTTVIVQLAEQEIALLKEAGLSLLELIVDEPGVGGGVIDRLRELGYPVRAYDGGKPLVKGVDPEDECRMFANKRARDWWALRRKLEVGSYPLPNDEVLLAQLASLHKTYNAQEKIVAESKQDLKDRLGDDASPDRGDVIVMGSCPWYTAAAIHGTLTEDDVGHSGMDRPTSEYADDMANSLV